MARMIEWVFCLKQKQIEVAMRRSACITVLVCLGALPFGAIGQTTQEFQKTVAAYIEETKDLGSEEKARQHAYEHWLGEFLKVAASTESAQVREASLRHAMSLANGLGKYDLSRDLVRKLLASADNWMMQVRLNTELGEIQDGIYAQGGKQQDKDAARDCYRTAYELALAHSDVVATSPSLARDFAVSSMRFALILETQSNGSSQAADVFEQGRLFLQRAHKNVALGIRDLGYGPGVFLDGELVAAGRTRDTERIYRVLNEAAKEKGEGKPLSELFQEAIRAAYPDGGRAYWSAVQAWIDQKPKDSFTPILMYYCAEDMLAKNEDLKAIGIYEVLLRDYQRVLANQDKSAAKAGAGGYLAGVLYNSAQAYAYLGYYERSETLLKEFLQLYPNDSRAESARGHLARLAEDSTKRDRKMMDSLSSGVSKVKVPEPRPSAQVGLPMVQSGGKQQVTDRIPALWFLGAVVVLLGAVLCVAWRKLYRRRV